jgi:hypothetical protein
MKTKTPMSFADKVVTLLEAQEEPYRLPSGLLRPTMFSPDQVRKAIVEVQRQEQATMVSSTPVLAESFVTAAEIESATRKD